MRPRQRPAFDVHAAGKNRGADCIRIRFRVYLRVGGAELVEAVDIAVADQRLAVLCGPALRPAIEIQPRRVHRVPFHRVEQPGVPIEIATERRR